MLLDVNSVSKSFGYDGRLQTVLKDVSLQLGAGETLALTGESGSGKSTLLTVIAGLDRPDAGIVTLNGADIHALPDASCAKLRRESIGLVFQQFNLIPSLTVSENLAFQARLAGRFDPAHVELLTRTLGLGDHRAKYPEQLSGGQQQRVAIGRALAGRPALLLADEPTGNLDEGTSDAVLDLMLGLVADTGASLLMVTHSARMAARLDHRLHLSGGAVS